MTSLFLFFIAQLVNVILNTIKTLIMAKFDSKHLSAIANATTFGFYTVVVKLIADMPLEITVPVTTLTNIIGVYASYEILGFFKKDELWKVEVYAKTGINNLANSLHSKGLQVARKNSKLLNVYCYTQADSQKLKEILKSEYPEAKTNVTVINKRL